MISAPMLAAPLTRPPRFPVLATPKLDGIRGFTHDHLPRTRSGDPLPNRFARDWIARHCPDGFDGELLVRGLSFHDSCRALMTERGRPDFEFHVFDFVLDDCEESYAQRIAELQLLEFRPVEPAEARVHFVLPELIQDQPALDAFERRMLAAGYEGICVRDPDGPYCAGKTTEREGWLLKLKRSIDAEAVIVGCERGARGTLGALTVEREGVRFQVGTGFTHAQAAQLWRERDTLPGQLVKFSHCPRAGQRAPSSAVFLGLRPVCDL